jgi:putative endonuclease
MFTIDFITLLLIADYVLQWIIKGFTSKYNIIKLVYTEEFTDIKEALTREKNLKKWKRSWKIELIEKTNPELKDLIE